MDIVWATLNDLVDAVLAGQLHNPTLVSGVLAAWTARSGTPSPGYAPRTPTGRLARRWPTWRRWPERVPASPARHRRGRPVVRPPRHGRPTDADRAEAELLRAAGIAERGLVGLSVRSAWDLLLGVLDWPPGSEVLVSAVTHPEWSRSCGRTGCAPVPVDLDLDAMAPPVAALEAARTERTRGLLVAHLFGGRLDIEPIRDSARQHGLLLVEDSAQAFTGLASLAPSGADVSLFSFA